MARTNLLGLASLIVLMALGIAVSAPVMVLAPDSLGRNVSNAFFRLWSRWTLRAFGVRVFVVGREHLEGPPSVLVANHRSHLDVPVLGAVLRAPVCTVYKRSLARVPLLGLALWLSRSVGIDRDDARDSHTGMDTVAGRVRSGRSLLVFPEGRRGTGPVLGPFKRGAVTVALGHQLDLIPVSILGTDVLFAPGQLLVRPGNALVVVHPRRSTAGMSWQDRALLSERMREAVAGAFEMGRPSAERLALALRVL